MADPRAARRFIFCHVPRSAGTSIATALAGVFGHNHSVIQADPRDRTFLRFLARPSPDRVFASGHISLPQALRIKRRCPGVVLISSYRNPVHHALSLYLHNKHFADPRICKDGRDRLPFDELLRDYDPSKLFDANIFNVLTRVFSGRSLGSLSRRDVDYAASNAADIDVFLNGDTLQQDLDSFCETYDLPKPSLPYLNSNPYHSDRTADVELISKVRDVQSLDLQLLERLHDRHGRQDVGETTSQGKPFMLAEAIRRSKFVAYAPPQFFRFDNNSIMLHPTSGFKSTLVSTIELPTGTARSLRGWLRLPAECGSAVTFRLLFEADSWSNTFEQTVAPGQDMPISVFVPAASEVRLTLETEISPPGSSCDYASAMFSDLSFLEEDGRAVAV